MGIFCNCFYRLNECIPQSWADRALVGASVTMAAFNPVMGLSALGGYAIAKIFPLQIKKNPKNPLTTKTQVVTQAVISQASSSRSLPDGGALSLIGTNPKNSLPPAAQVEEKTSTPSISPPRLLRNGGNTCFLSAILWALFLNEKGIQEELARAPIRLIKEGVLSLAIKDYAESLQGEEKKLFERLYELVEQWGREEAEFKQIHELKKIMERFDLTPVQEVHSFKTPAIELLSLIELNDLVQECKKSDPKPVEGANINALRDVLHRLKPQVFQEVSHKQEDAYEAFITLADLIFERSPLNKNVLQTVRKLNLAGAVAIPKPSPLFNPATGEMRGASESNWGRFELPLSAHSTVKQLLEDTFFEKKEGAITDDSPKYETERGKVPFGLLEVNRKWTAPPPFLVLNLKRFSQVKKIEDPIEPEKILKLDSRFFCNGAQAKYELCAVVYHSGAKTGGHYTAQINKEGAYFDCNDLSREIRPIQETEFLEMAKTGYILVYRLKSGT